MLPEPSTRPKSRQMLTNKRARGGISPAFRTKHQFLNYSDRLGELDRDKTIVTVCPHYDRAEIARLYLTLEGFTARYLTNGMLGIADALRGDKARDYIMRLNDQQ